MLSRTMRGELAKKERVLRVTAHVPAWLVAPREPQEGEGGEKMCLVNTPDGACYKVPNPSHVTAAPLLGGGFFLSFFFYLFNFLLLLLLWLPIRGALPSTATQAPDHQDGKY